MAEPGRQLGSDGADPLERSGLDERVTPVAAGGWASGSAAPRAALRGYPVSHSLPCFAHRVPRRC